MHFKPAVTALVSAVALATLLSGCKKEEAAAPAAPPPQVGVVTLHPQAFTLTTFCPHLLLAPFAKPTEEGGVISQFYL